MICELKNQAEGAVKGADHMCPREHMLALHFYADWHRIKYVEQDEVYRRYFFCSTWDSFCYGGTRNVPIVETGDLPGSFVVRTCLVKVLLSLMLIHSEERMYMRRIIDIQKQLMPDVTDVLRKRYTVLKSIMVSGMVGRRTLAASLGMTERVLRAEVDFLKAQGLLEMMAVGMQVTPAGSKLLDDIEPFVKDLFGLTEMEEKIRQRYGLKQVIVVPGDSEQSPHTKRELGLAGAQALRKHVKPHDVVSVTGGSTLAEVANLLTFSATDPTCMFAPARGGLGENVELQANTIASTMAKRTGGQYRLLHVPDHLGDDAYQSLMLDPNIQEIVEVIRRARIVIHGIGNAMTMARRRKSDERTLELLKQEGAHAEAFGYYFDRDGNVVHKIPTVGLKLEDIMSIEVVIGVAGGSSKAEAIEAVLKFGHEDVLVTDEAAAQMIASGI